MNSESLNPNFEKKSLCGTGDIDRTKKLEEIIYQKRRTFEIESDGELPEGAAEDIKDLLNSLFEILKKLDISKNDLNRILCYINNFEKQLRIICDPNKYDEAIDKYGKHFFNEWKLNKLVKERKPRIYLPNSGFIVIHPNTIGGGYHKFLFSLLHECTHLLAKRVAKEKKGEVYLCHCVLFDWLDEAITQIISRKLFKNKFKNLDIPSPSYVGNMFLIGGILDKSTELGKVKKNNSDDLFASSSGDIKDFGLSNFKYLLNSYFSGSNKIEELLYSNFSPEQIDILANLEPLFAIVKEEKETPDFKKISNGEQITIATLIKNGLISESFAKNYKSFLSRDKGEELLMGFINKMFQF